MIQPLAAAHPCQHCGEPAPPENKFCCAGCESVYVLLSSRGLTHYYKLRDQFPIRRGRPVERKAIPRVLPVSAGPEAKLYLEGIHCLGCLWLLEKLPEIDDRIQSASLDIAHQILDVKIKAGAISWSETLILISQLGYSAKIIEENEGEQLRLSDQRRQLNRVALAGFSAGNVMLLSVSVYAGADAWWSRNFGWLSLALAAPALTYGAWPIYRSAFGPLRKKRISVDLAIALALLAGTFMSLWSLARGTADTIYFDSLTMLVFLLLSSRFLLSRMRSSLAKEGTCLSLLSGEAYAKEDGTRAAAADIKKDDILFLTQGQTVPADSVLLSAASHFDLSLLNGESHPEKFFAGDVIDSGVKNLNDGTKIKVIRPAGESRLARILEQIQAFQIQRAQSLDFADRLGRIFVWVVLFTALSTVLLLPAEEGLRRALAFVIVTCPCVLAFAVPLTITRALQVAARRGIVFRGADKIEELAAAREIFLDKTGTLTTGQFEVTDWRQRQGGEEEARRAARALELKSSHPVAKAILRFTKNDPRPAIANSFREIPGLGVTGEVDGMKWSVLHLDDCKPGSSCVGVFKEQELVAEIFLGDSLRPEAQGAVKSLERMGLKVALLSGDSETNVAATAAALGIKSWRSRLLPEEKAAHIAHAPHTVMVGDGANDAVAFQGASVGIAMQGAMEISLKNSDVMLTSTGLSSLVDAIKISRRTMRLIRANFAFTLSYNLLAGTLALTGHMSPLIAAVIMPASAMTVFAFTFWRSSGGKL